MSKSNAQVLLKFFSAKGNGVRPGPPGYVGNVRSVQIASLGSGSPKTLNSIFVVEVLPAVGSVSSDSLAAISNRNERSYLL